MATVFLCCLGTLTLKIRRVKQKKTPIGCGRSRATLAAFPLDQHRGRDLFFTVRINSIVGWVECLSRSTNGNVRCNASAIFFQSGSHASRALHAPTAASIVQPLFSAAAGATYKTFESNTPRQFFRRTPTAYDSGHQWSLKSFLNHP